MKLEWSIFKQYNNAKGSQLDYFNYPDKYYIFTNSNETYCELFKDISDNTDLLDFENNYKNNANKNTFNQIVKTTAFANNENFRFRGVSFAGEATAGQTTNIDFQLTAERYMNGGKLILLNNDIDDKICFQVVDKDNVLGYGANAVLDEFIKDFYLPIDAPLEINLPYTARLYNGLYLRLVYKSAGQNNVKVKCNLYLHWKTAWKF